MIPKSQISLPRRIAEATSAKLHYDYLCGKGYQMGEEYLTFAISDLINCFLGTARIKTIKNFIHHGLSANKNIGRKTEIDYMVTEIDNNNPILAIEVKWAGSTHCNDKNILWDLIRLKIIKDAHPNCTCLLLIAGQKDKFEKVFSSNLFKPGTQHPLQQGSPFKKVFPLESNDDHQLFISAEISKKQKKYPSLKPPAFLITHLSDATKSAASTNRFLSKIWTIS